MLRRHGGRGPVRTKTQPLHTVSRRNLHRSALAANRRRPQLPPIARTTAPPNMETHVKNTREPTTTPTNQPVFPSDHVFVVQFHPRARGQGVGEAGRVVHLHSGDAARFHTRDELLAFTRRVLNRQARLPGRGRPARAGPEPSPPP